MRKWPWSTARGLPWARLCLNVLLACNAGAASVAVQRHAVGGVQPCTGGAAAVAAAKASGAVAGDGGEGAVRGRLVDAVVVGVCDIQAAAPSMAVAFGARMAVDMAGAPSGSSTDPATVWMVCACTAPRSSRAPRYSTPCSHRAYQVLKDRGAPCRMAWRWSSRGGSGHVDGLTGWSTQKGGTKRTGRP